MEHPDVGFYKSLSNDRNQGSLEKWLILGLEQGKYKMNLGHFVVLEGNAQNEKKDGGISKGHRSQPERLPNGQSWKTEQKTKKYRIRL